MTKKVKFSSMILRKWLKKSFLGGILRFFPLALLASGADAAVLWGIRAFMDIVVGDKFAEPVAGTAMSLPLWVCLMVLLTAIRLVSLYLKTKISERWLYNTCGRVNAWFLHGLRNLSPRVFHTPEGERQVEAAYESTVVLQNNGSVLFQAVQAVLQLVVFLPVILYISWQLSLFLFIFVVPFVGLLQRKLHKLGPAEESLLRERSDFRGELNLARRLFCQWSSAFERKAVSNALLKKVRTLRDHGFETSVRKSGLSLVIEAVSVLAMVFVLGFCALLINNGLMDGSGLVLFCSAVLLSYKPVKECARVMPQFRSVMSALNVLVSFECLPQKGSNAQVSRHLSQGNAVSSDQAVSVKNQFFEYDGSDKPVFENFSICWSREKPVLVRGKNGAGKSTFLRLLAGLEQWNGYNESAAAINGDVFFVAQDLELPPKYLLQMLLERSEHDAVAQFMEFAGVETLLRKSALSGGERAKVALLWALASDSRTILLDEPFASVALADREALLSAFLEGAESLGKWTIVISHDALSPQLESRFNIAYFGQGASCFGAACAEGAEHQISGRGHGE